MSCKISLWYIKRKGTTQTEVLRGAKAKRMLWTLYLFFHSLRSRQEKSHLAITDTKSSYCGLGDWHKINGIASAAGTARIFNIPEAAGQWEESAGREVNRSSRQEVCFDWWTRILYLMTLSLIYVQPARPGQHCCQEFSEKRQRQQAYPCPYFVIPLPFIPSAFLKIKTSALVRTLCLWDIHESTGMIGSKSMHA